MIKPKECVTSWYKFNDIKKIYEFNHIENNHIIGDYPLPIKQTFKEQKVWKSYKWKFEHGYLVDGKYYTTKETQ